MKLGLMQPYFFPYLGYFDLIYQADIWVVFDVVQYIRRGWMNRNRVLHPEHGWQYITIPVKKCHLDTPIHEIEISENVPWRDRMIGQLQHYKKRAPFFSEVMAIVDECISTESRLLSNINLRSLSLVCEYLGISFSPPYFSDMSFDANRVAEPGDWALFLSEALGVDEYVNPPGGVQIYHPDKFKCRGIKLTFNNLPTFEYNCRGYEFIPNLSIIDVLMWNEPAKVMEFLEQRK